MLSPRLDDDDDDDSDYFPGKLVKDFFKDETHRLKIAKLGRKWC